MDADGRDKDELAGAVGVGGLGADMCVRDGGGLRKLLAA